MVTSEPFATAALVFTFGLLMAVSVLFSRALEKLGVPILLLFLLLGIAAGSEGIGGIEFDNYQFAFRIGALALILILFDGGLNTPWRSVKGGIGPATSLATFGVVGAAGLTACAARLFGLPWPEALLLGAVVSSTDAAAVFAVLRGSRLNLQKRAGVTLELESGLNDPMAVILTTALTQVAATGATPSWHLVWQAPLQLVIGALVGLLVGWLGLVILARIRLRAGGLYPVLTLGFALVAFGAATLVFGSGFLAVYTAGVVIGNSRTPYRYGLKRIHDALAWLGQISMFLILGMLVFPSQLISVAPMGIGIALFLAFVARPIATFLCLAPFRYPTKHVTFIAWAGLRGAVPIILATIPVLAGAPAAMEVFNIVFFVVFVNAILPGATLRWATKWLGLERTLPPDPPAVIEINSTQLLDGEILLFYIDETLAVAGVPISKIRLPEGSAVLLVMRGAALIAARGSTVLTPGDHIYLFCHQHDRPFIDLLFGGPAT